MPITPDPFQHLDPNRSLWEQLSVERVNQLFDRLRANELMPGPGINLSRVGGGVAAWQRKQRGGGGIPPWPFKVYNTTSGSTGQVQINGADGSLASLSPTDGVASGIACVNGNPTNATTGSPPNYPQLAVTGNGVIYAICYLNSSGQVTPGASVGGTGVDILYAGSVPAPDTANPPTYGVKLLATISNYATDGLGNVSFSVGDANGPVGVTTVQVCGSTVIIN